MNNLYLDTNIFIYLADDSSKYHKDCIDLINYCQDHKILIFTSTETIQEIIHYCKNTKQLSKGILVAKNILKIADEILTINKKTIEVYLELAEKYTTRTSRDLIHVSVCMENKLDKIVTYDGDFKIFKTVQTLQPKEIQSIK